MQRSDRIRVTTRGNMVCLGLRVGRCWYEAVIGEESTIELLTRLETVLEGLDDADKIREAQDVRAELEGRD